MPLLPLHTYLTCPSLSHLQVRPALFSAGRESAYSYCSSHFCLPLICNAHLPYYIHGHGRLSSSTSLSFWIKYLQQTHKLIKCTSSMSRDVIFAEKISPCGNAPQHCTGLVKLTISLLFETIGDDLILIGDYSRLIGEYS